MSDFIPVNTPLLAGNERKYLNECLDTGWISSEGPFVKRFETEFAAYVGRAHGIAVCNGSVALDMAVVAAGVVEGDEVILPTFTIMSCAAAVVRAGAVPVLVDSDPVTFNMDVSAIRAKITPRTKAIMVVHIYGLPCDLDPILALAREFDLQIIEDAAEMHGQTYRGKRCGSFGSLSTFSFYPNKHITTGEGGMVLTDNDEVAERCRLLRNLYFHPKKRYVHDELGWNFRMTNLQAALGVAQLEQIDGFVERKRAMGRFYAENLKGVPGLRLPITRNDTAENIYWVYGIVIEDDHPLGNEDALRRLGELGIGTRSFFWPMHEQPALQKRGLFKGESYPVAERLARKGFYIPSGLALTREEMSRVVEAVKAVFK